MKVKANQKGFDGTAIREAGDVFEVPDDTQIDKDSWFQPLSKKEAKAQDATDGQGASNLV